MGPTELRDDPLIGVVIDGRYRLMSLVSSGGMGTVYRAVDSRLDRVVALKVMHRSLAEDPGFVARFEREARAAARLSDPHVVGVFDQGSDGDLVWLAMDYVRGFSLREIIAAHAPLEADRALGVVEQILSGLATAHEAGFVHGDIKPENVVMASDGTMKITDFGLARAAANDAATATDEVRDAGAGGTGRDAVAGGTGRDAVAGGTGRDAVAGGTGRAAGAGEVLLGTAAYVAPELVTAGVADERSDIYATGVVLFELLTGEVPFAGWDPLAVAHRHVYEDVPLPSSRVPEVPADVDALVARATARDPKARFATAREFLAAARAIEVPVGPEPSTGPTAIGTTAVGLGSRHAAGTVVGGSAAALGEPFASPGNPMTAPGAAAEITSAPSPGLSPTVATEHPAHHEVVSDPVTQATVALSPAGNPIPAAGIQPRQPPGTSHTSLKADSAGNHTVALGSAANPTAALDGSGNPAASLGPTANFTAVLGPGTNPTAVLGGSGNPAASLGAHAHATTVLNPGATTVESPAGHPGYADQPGWVASADPEWVGRPIRSVSRFGRTKAVVILAALAAVMAGFGWWLGTSAEVAVPNVAGQTAAQAQLVLAEVGVENTDVSEEFDASTPAGVVLGTLPPTGTVVPRDGGVTLIVSKGPEPVVVPSLVGQSVTQATATLEGLGLVVATRNQLPFVVLNRVISQDTEVGSAVPPGTTITLSIV